MVEYSSFFPGMQIEYSRRRSKLWGVMLRFSRNAGCMTVKEEYENLERRVIRSSVDWSGAGFTLAEYLAGRFTYRAIDEWRDRIAAGEIMLNGELSDPERRLELHDRIEYFPADIAEPEADLDYRIAYEDDALLAVRKPAPLQVHPSPSAPRGADTLEGRVQRYLHSGAHPVHRLDAETTGIVLFAKLPYAQAHIQRQMQTDAFRKEYLAWVCGVPAAPEGVIDAPIDRIAPDSFTRAVLPGGQHAVTRYRVEAICGDVSLVRFSPVTGRTHQLRVHAAHIGHPMLGDTRYCTAESTRLAEKYRAPYHQLSAVRLSLTHPVTGKTLEIACPPDFSVDIAPL